MKRAAMLAAAGVLCGAVLAVGARPTVGERHAPLRADAASLRPFSKLAVVFLENRSYREIIGSPNAPYINRLARRGALALHYYAIAHPSLPNYMALTTGSTLGIKHDCNSCDTARPTLATQLDDARIPWRAYFEALPHRGYVGSRFGDYSKHLNPFAYSERIADGPSGATHVVSFNGLRTDLARQALPRFSWIAPDLGHDGHNGSVRTSDRYLSRLAPKLIRALGPHGVLFVTWDEGHGKVGPKGGHVALIAAGGGARHHARLRLHANHYALLGTLESGLGLPALGHAADHSTPLLSGLLAPPRPAS